jgi:uncharacterized protein YukE
MGNHGTGGAQVSWGTVEQGSGDASVTTHFETWSHEQMVRAVAKADPNPFELYADKCERIADPIDEFGEDLRRRAPRVEWEGKAHEAFLDWTDRMSSGSLRLGAMCPSAAEALRRVAQVILEVKRDMPEYSLASRRTLDRYLVHAEGLGPGRSLPASAPTPGEAARAQQRLEEDHGEAVRQMRKLAQAYTLAAETLRRIARPAMPPMPFAMMPPKVERVYGTAQYETGSHFAGTRPQGRYASLAAVTEGIVPDSSAGIGTVAQVASGTPASNETGVGMQLAGGMAVAEAAAPSATGAVPASSSSSQQPDQVPGRAAAGPTGPKPVVGTGRPSLLQRGARKVRRTLNYGAAVGAETERGGGGGPVSTPSADRGPRPRRAAAVPYGGVVGAPRADEPAPQRPFTFGGRGLRRRGDIT